VRKSETAATPPMTTATARIRRSTVHSTSTHAPCRARTSPRESSVHTGQKYARPVSAQIVIRRPLSRTKKAA
jgi:hypothetical protein